MTKKICKKCNTEKEITKNGYIFCRKCKLENSKKFHLLNKNNINLQKRQKKNTVIIYNDNITKICKN